MSAHSPEPWTFSYADGGSIYDAAGKCLADHLQDTDGSEADALLMALAPELLALARRQQEWISRALAAFEGEPDPSENEGKNIDASACALIARVEAGK